MVAGMISCLDMGDEDQTQYYLSWATVSSNDETPDFLADCDWTLNASNYFSDTIFDVGDRAFIRFSFDDTTYNSDDTYPITLVNYYKATIKDFVTIEADSDDIYEEQDFYTIINIDISKGYLNAAICPYESYSTVNTIELVRFKGDEPGSQAVDTPTVYMELRHNTAAVNTNYYYVKAFCFDLSPLKDEFPDAEAFKIHFACNVNTSGDIEGNIYYYPEDTTQVSGVPKRQVLMPFQPGGLIPPGY